MASLTYDLHVVTARLDRAADVILQREVGIGYRRFLTLFAVTLGNGSQRDLATWLGQSEPSVSRMVAVLSREGLLVASRSPGSGNRRELRLTPDGESIVKRGGAVLEGRFEELVRRAGVSYARYQRDTQRLLMHLDGGRRPAGSPEDAA